MEKVEKFSTKFLISLLSFVLCAICISFSTLSVNALESKTIQVSEKFIDYVADSFLNQDKVSVINKEGIDITEQYFSDNSNSFRKKDYESIKLYFEKNIDTICIDESVESINTRSPFVNQTVSKRYYKVLNKEQASGEIEYYLNGSLVWDRATGKITSIGNASINITHNSFGAGWKKHISNMSTNSSLSSDKYYATFSGGFNLRVTFSMGITIFDVDFGRLTASTTVHPEG